MERITLLLVEDDENDLLILQGALKTLEDDWLSFDRTGTLKSAVKRLRHYHFDVVLLDLFLPDSSGIDTVRRIISEYNEMPVIVIAGIKDEGLAALSIHYGAMDYLEKRQITPLLLRKSIRYARERKQLLKEKEDLLSDLSLAYKKLESLEGVLPLCVSCRRMLNDGTRWLELEEYIGCNADVASVEGRLCPDCAGRI